MENNLDKYFRENLHDRKYEMKEEHWLGAERLLLAAERRRKRRVLFWWFGSGLALFLLALLGWWLVGSGHGAVNPNSAQASPSATQEPATTTQAATSTQPPVAGAADVSSGTIAGSSAGAESEAGQRPSGLAAIAEGKKQSNALRNTQPRSSQKPENQSVAKPKTRSSNLNSTLNNAAGSAEKAAAPPKSEPSIQPPIPSQQTGFPSENAAEATAQRPEAPGRLALLPCLVHVEFAEPDLAARVREATKTEVADQRRFHAGLLLAPLGQLRPDSAEQRFLATRLGIACRFDLRNGWYMGSGLLYQHRKGTFSVAKTALQLRYSFGVSKDTMSLRPKSLHYVTLPVVLGWRHRGHEFEGGVLFDYLTGIRGEITHAGSDQLQQGWMTTSGYRRLVPAAQFSYRFAMLNKWSVGISANYGLSSIIASGNEADKYRLLETNKFMLGLQLGYQFF